MLLCFICQPSVPGALIAWQRGSTVCAWQMEPGKQTERKCNASGEKKMVEH